MSNLYKDYNENNKNNNSETKTVEDVKLEDNKKLIEKINDFLREWRKPIIGISFILCLMLSLNIVNDILFSNSDTKKIQKENITLKSEIDNLEKENKKIEKDIQSLSIQNNNSKQAEKKAIEDSFKAIPGTKWSGAIQWKNDSQPLNVKLDIKKEEIILTGINLQWDRLENEGETFNPVILLSTGNIEKKTGYMKLNRISLQNVPDYAKEWSDNCMPYDYELIVNKDYINGFVLDNNKVVGNIFLEKSK